MDQITCSVGGFVSIDFRNEEDPKVEKIEYDFNGSGYTLFIVSTGGSHADLNPDYASIPAEMKEAAGYFGKKTLREVSLEEIMDRIGGMRDIGNDRAILRAIHYENENARVLRQVQALKDKDMKGFLGLVSESGSSSWRLCQNVYSCANVKEQGISLALAVSENILGTRGACRVHGGGFAGTIQAFVPDDLKSRYVSGMNDIFGEGSCLELHIRPEGAVKIL
jgi:galactokinase